MMFIIGDIDLLFKVIDGHLVFLILARILSMTSHQRVKELGFALYQAFVDS